MEQPRTHQLAARIKTGLFAAMAASAAWTLYQAYLDLEDLGLLQQGADAELWSDLSLEGFWFLMAARVATVLLLLAFARWLAPLPWGRDVTRSETGWADTDPMAYWVGEASAAPTLTESPTMVKVLAIAAPIGLLLAATMVSSVVLETLGSMSHESVWLIVVLPMLGLACFLWHAWLQASSRRLRYDDAGLTDSSFFRTLRVPWSMVGSFDPKLPSESSERVSAFSAARSSSELSSGRTWVLYDKGGQTLFHLHDNMVPAQAFAALRSRLRAPGQAAPSGGLAAQSPEQPAASDQPSELAEAEDAEQAFMREHEKAFEQHAALNARHNRGMYLGMALMLLPFVLGTAYMGYQAFWYQFAAARVEGRVVEVVVEKLPSLRVEYRSAEGKALQISSDGSNTYQGYAVGDRVTVLVDPQAPESAYLDFFLELWLLPMIVGSITLLVALMTLLIVRTMRSPRRTSMRPPP